VPGVADDEVRDRDRQHHQHAPQPRQRQPGADHAPRGGRPGHPGGHRDQDGQADRVAQQLSRQRPDQDAVHLGPAGVAGLQDEEHLGQQQGRRHGRPGHVQGGGGRTAEPPHPPGRRCGGPGRDLRYRAQSRPACCSRSTA
jgi:hypothetical protein